MFTFMRSYVLQALMAMPNSWTVLIPIVGNCQHDGGLSPEHAVGPMPGERGSRAPR